MSITYEQVNKIPKSKIIKKYINLLPYIGKPQYNISSYNSYLKKLIKDSIIMYKLNNINLEKAKESNNIKLMEIYQELLNDKINLTPNINKIISESNKDIYMIIDYPLDIKIIFKYQIEDSIINLGKLLYLNSHMYQELYKNTKKYQIWGHLISDLCYNGISTIKVYDKFITCYFSVDS